MSLITDPVLTKLWEAAQRQPSDERPSAKLWVQLWSKDFFAEKDWAISQEIPPQGAGRRRVDIAIEYMGADDEVTVFAFHKAKPPDAGPQDVREMEGEASDACKRYLERHPSMESVYAFTSFGTRGRAWRFSRGNPNLEPLFGSKLDVDERSQYVELHSTEAQLIRGAVQSMRGVPVRQTEF